MCFCCQNPNSTSTQPNITYVGFDMKMTLHIYAVEPQYMLWNLHPKLNVGNISAVTYPILTKH